MINGYELITIRVWFLNLEFVFDFERSEFVILNFTKYHFYETDNQSLRAGAGYQPLSMRQPQ
jgi:hypothetical protein